MMKLFMFALLALSVVSARADELKPYLEGSEHRISEREYSDLKSYVERAEKILLRTLDDSSAFSGFDLRAHLMSGVGSALASTELRGELLLFRYVLTRALETDDIFFKSQETAERAQLVSQIVLIPAIESALKYYQTIDLPRLASNVVPSPNWLEFAAEQVPHLLRAVDLAPSKDKSIEVAWLALGWTARALNSSLERRNPDVADFIVRLGELYNSPNRRHPAYLSRAQEALLDVNKKYRAPLKVVALAPASAGTDLKMRSRGVGSRLGGGIRKLVKLPVLGVGSQGTIGKDWTKDDTKDDGTVEMNHVTDIKFARAAIFVGAGMSATYDSQAGDRAVGGNALYLNARFAATNTDCDKYNGCGPTPNINAEVSAFVMPEPGSGDWRYSGSASVSAGFWGVASGLVAIERSDYGVLEETLMRAGWAPHLIVRTGKAEYVLVQGYFGSMSSNIHIRKHLELGAKVVIQRKRFAVSTSFYQAGNPTEEGAEFRAAADGMVTLPLGLFFRNDALTFKGQAVKYETDNEQAASSSSTPTRSVSAASGLIFYGLSW